MENMESSTWMWILFSSYYAGITVPIQHEFTLNGKNTEMSSQQTNQKLVRTHHLKFGGHNGYTRRAGMLIKFK